MSDSKLTVDDLCQSIWEVERRFDLLNMQIDGVKAWQYIRVPIYYHIAEKAGVFLTPHARNNTKLSKLVTAFKYLQGSIIHNPFLFQKQVDQVIIEHQRSSEFNGRFVDIYSWYYLDHLKNKGMSYLCLDPADNNFGHRKAHDPDRRYMDFIALMGRLAGMFHTKRLTMEQIRVIKSVNYYLSNQLNVKLDIEKLITSSVIKFKVKYSLYRALFKRVKPARLTLLVGYMNGDAISAAKDLGIETIEIQHGTFSRYHLGYSYPDPDSNLDYFPEFFFSWGRYWSDMGVIPLSKEAIKTMGFPYFNDVKKSLSHIKKDHRRVVVLSQGALGMKIAETIYDFREVLHDYEIIYKLHPGEFARWQDYEPLLKLSKLTNFKIAKQDDLYELLASAKYQIGVFSTAIYEGIGLGCTTILLDLPGVEYMHGLVGRGLAVVVRTPEELTNELESVGSNSLESEIIFGRDTELFDF